jgi:tRNA A37 threonylcarbamoyltransferase TsaD
VGVETTFPSHELKTRLTDVQRHDFAASFQHTAVKTLVDTTLRAVETHKPASVVIAGGVAANQELRRQLADRLPFPIQYAPISLCTDNGAMIACLGYYMAQALKPTDPSKFKVIPSLSMSQTAWRNSQS